MKFSKLLITIFALAFASCAFADPPGSGTNNGNNCVENCGHSGGQGGGGGQGGNGGSGTAIGVGVGISSATGIASSTSTSAGGAGIASAAVNSSGSGYGGTQSQSNGNIKSYSLSAASVGSPTQGTCAAHVALLFGLATFPVTLDSCVALNEAAFLLSVVENKQAAIERLCQLSSIAKTSLCPKWNTAESSSKEPPQ